jgi:hypothetical protein
VEGFVKLDKKKRCCEGASCAAPRLVRDVDGGVRAGHGGDGRVGVTGLTLDI